MQVAFEAAKLSDLEELLKIERECFASEAYTKEQISNLLKGRNTAALLARVDGATAGFVISSIERLGAVKVGHIITLDVATEYRRKGIGLALVKKTEDDFLIAGAKAVYLEVRVDNKMARNLYKKRGYIEAETLEHYYSGVSGLRLVKQLSP